MKNLYFLIIALFAMTFVSCQFTEEITINKNGSGTYKLNVDMGGMISTMNGMSQNDSIKEEPEKLDSIVNFSDILEAKKDSISQLSEADKAVINAIKDMKMRIQVDEEKGVMLMDFILDFKNISEIDDIKRKLEKANQLQENKGKEEVAIENHEIHYSYNKKKFTRSVVMKELSAEEQEQFEASQKQANTFLSGSKYKLIYNFPKKIQKVSYKDAQFSDNRKSLIIVVEMDSLTKNPQLLDFEVIF